jgi:type I restriction enzyme, S subunit
MNNKVNSTNIKHETKSGTLPNLRFPEFHGDWEYQKLNEIAYVITEKTGNKKYTLMSITSGLGLVSQMEKFGREIAGEQYQGYFVIRENDFAYNKSATKEYPEGFIAMYSGEEAAAVPNSIFTCFKVRDTSVIPQYLNYLFWGNLHGKWLRKFIAVGARAHGSLNVDNEDLLSLPVPLPKGTTSFEEQQKIADCLSSLNEQINAQSQKVDVLKVFKKGLLQQLFPVEGETTPQLRFPEFRDDWTVKKLGELGWLTGGGTPDRSVSEYWRGKIPWISSSDIYEDDIHTISITRFINEKSISESATKIIPKGSVLFVSRVGTGKLAINDKDVCTSQDFLNFIPKKINNYFLGYFFIANKLALVSLDQGTSIKGFSKSDLEKFELRFPSEPEQQKIADCLSSLDEQIDAQSQKVDVLKVFKKGLLQQVFPSPEKVQG